MGYSDALGTTTVTNRVIALTAIKARAPVLGGNFGVWGGMFSTFDCAVKGIRYVAPAVSRAWIMD